MRARALALAAGSIAGMIGCTSEDRAQCAIVSSIGLVDQSGSGTVTATFPSPNELDIDLGDVPVGLSDTATVTIQNSGAGALALSLVVPNLDPQLSVNAPAAVAPDDAGGLSLTFQPYKVGPVSSTFTIDFQEPASCPADAGLNHPPVTVNLTGAGLQLCLTITPSVLDFGTTPIGTTVTKTVTLTTCEGTIAGLINNITGGDASLFKVQNPPESLGPNASYEVNISYSPTALEERSLAVLIFSGDTGENATMNLFGEPTDKADGGVACLPGGDYCCDDEATIVSVGQSDPQLCRTCTIDAGVAGWSLWPVGAACEPSYGDAGACVVSTTSADSEYCDCRASTSMGIVACGADSVVNEDVGVFACCFGRCIFEAGANIGVCPCYPGEDGGLCP